MTPADEKKIKDWNQKRALDLAIGFQSAGTPEGKALSNFCDRLASIAPNIRIERMRAEAEEAPAIRIRENLLFHAVPQDRELEPFLLALEFHAGVDLALSDAIRERLGRIQTPALLNIYVTPPCPFCPNVVAGLLPLAFANGLVRMRVMDCSLFTAMAEQDGIRSAPTVVLDNQYRWTGQFPVDELVDVLTGRDPANPGAAAIENIIKQGHAAQIAAMMRDRGRVFPHFIRLLAHDSLSVRIGAIVVVEELAETSPSLAREMIDPLWERFEHVDDTVRGDILYVVGLLRDSQNKSRIDSVLRGPYSANVKQAAQETLEETNWI